MYRISQMKNTLLILLCIQGSVAFAQSDTNCGKTDDKKAIELYKKGTDMKSYQKGEREEFLKKAIELEPDYVAANFALAEDYVTTAYTNQTPFDPAVPYFMAVINACPQYHSDPYYYIAISYYEANRNDDAMPYFQKYVDFKDEDVKKYSKNYDQLLYNAKQKLKAIRSIHDIMANKVPFDPHPVKGLSTEYNEFLAIISPDNQLAFYTRKSPAERDMNSATNPEDNLRDRFMVSHRGADGIFDAGSPLPPPFNHGLHEGGPTVTIDNKHLYFAVCNGAKDCQLYSSDFANGNWGGFKNMGIVNDPSAWNAQPSISSDGQTLYFSSDRLGGQGGCDIWQTQKDSNGNWGQATNLGPGINTPGNENTPFIHSDSHTLYFSSDNWPGLGGMDIFYSRMDSSGKWSTPKNIGYPINSEGDDLGLFVSTDGKTAYFCSNDPSRANGENMGGYDIYQFALYPAARPEKVALLKGSITDKDGSPLVGATISITDAKTHKKITVMNDTVDASYAAVVNESKNEQYVVTVDKKGYAFNSGIVTAKDTFTGKPTHLDFNMQPISSGGNYVLNDIYYKTNSSQLETISVAVVKEFAKYMQANPGIKVRIAGYTDNVGSDQSNQVLSSNRASTVMQALIKEGIRADRLSYQGYGATNPVANNDTEEGRQKNRRTEFIIIQK
jgi:outer membrane protein OmpA-like peptidoglycan-associated protein/YHS domain-containing protein